MKKGDEVLLASKNAQAIRFKASDIRAMGRTAAGVKGMNLKKDDVLIGLMIISKETTTGGERIFLLNPNLIIFNRSIIYL
jgi:DNA gyrase/topoisomerase IV subunit A